MSFSTLAQKFCVGWCSLPKKMKLKTTFFVFLYFFVFFTLSFILSITFLRLPPLEIRKHTLDFLGPGDLVPDQDSSFLQRFHHKFNRIRRLDMGKLKRPNGCRFYCQPAVLNHQFGSGSSLKDPDPSVQIYIHHCLSCLRKKGLMDKITAYRMRRKDMLATPSSQVTSPNFPFKINPTNKKSQLLHAAFGGWLSHALDEVENKHLQDNFKSSNIKGIRKLLQMKAPNRRFYAVTKKPLLIENQMGDDYVNNYEDMQTDDGTLDFEKVEENTRKLTSNVLIGAFVFFGFLFIVIFPIVDFCKMCTNDFCGNLSLAGYILCCRDPKYKLVREMCDRKDIFIPKYREYKKIMKRLKDASNKKVHSVETLSSVESETNFTESTGVATESAESNNFDDSSSQNLIKFSTSSYDSSTT